MGVAEKEIAPEKAGPPAKINRSAVPHVFVALILTGIRARVPKRRTQTGYRMSFSDNELCRGWRSYLLIKSGGPDRFG
ncbi:MAG: hypothetical protein DMG43_04745 [Acidobacteria bacterium]|nr:MAG: hypothetical protein DMG43_04745 [Acidobacteriota bacterium]